MCILHQFDTILNSGTLNILQGLLSCSPGVVQLQYGEGFGCVLSREKRPSTYVAIRDYKKSVLSCVLVCSLGGVVSRRSRCQSAGISFAWTSLCFIIIIALLLFSQSWSEEDTLWPTRKRLIVAGAHHFRHEVYENFHTTFACCLYTHFNGKPGAFCGGLTKR